MSVYNAFSSVYGQAQQHPPPPTYQQQYPGYYPSTNPQAPSFDENSFRNLYAQRLGALTVNSRPIIQDLSMLAQNYPHMAHVVVDCIERQVRMVQPPFKLPLFYLLDSIAKNAFEPYAGVFASRIVRLFLDTYHVVDQQTQHKMREMMATWRNGAPNHRELFGPAVQTEIERVWGPSRNPTSQQVLTELDVVLVQKERAVQQNPYDELLQRHINALHELRKMVPTMGAADLTATLTRLREMGRAAVQPAQPAPPVAPISYSSSSYPTIPHMPFGYPAVPPVLPGPTSMPPVNLTAPALNAQNIISLLSSITSLQPGKKIAALSDDIEVSASMSLDDYEKAILRRKIKVTSNDITKTAPQVLPFLYIKDSPQCNECGMRFPAGEDGKIKLREHLDQHFRQNTKASENVGRGFSRSWFVGKKSWVVDIPDHPLNKGKHTTALMSEKDKAQAAEALQKQLEAKFIVVPPGQEGKPARCGICMENIQVEFMEDDDDGEWVWKNAVKVDNKIYHATCHHDWSLSAYNKKRLEDVDGSRQGTPDIQSRIAGSPKGTPQRIKSDSPRTPPSRLAALAGTKRKAAVNVEATPTASQSSKEGTPLLKVEDDEPRIKRRAIEV